VTSEFIIKPNFVNLKSKEGIEIYQEIRSNMIILTEIKKGVSDMEKCLRQNADQLRAYCLCNNQNIARGISIVGTFWIFTEYDIRVAKIMVSEP